MRKPSRQDSDRDYAPYTLYDKDKYVRIFYTRYSPSLNRRHSLIGWGSLAVVATLLFLSLFLASTEHHLAAAICSFSAAVGLALELLLYRYAEKKSWLFTYSREEQAVIKKGQRLYRLRDRDLQDRIAMGIGLLFALATIAGMIWMGIQCVILLLA